MRDYLYIPEGEGFGRQHANAAVLACVLSVVIHIGLLLGVIHLRLGFMALPRPVPTPTQQLTPVQIGEVKRASGTGAARAASDSGRSSFVADLGRESGALRRVPDTSILQPPALTESRLTGDLRNLAPPSALPKRAGWEPRREIMQIQQRIATEELPTLERRVIPAIERVVDAPDEIPEVKMDELDELRRQVAGNTLTPPAVGANVDAARVAGGGAGDGSQVAVAEPGTAPGLRLFEEKAGEVSPYTPVENLLKADVAVYTSLFDPKYAYFRVDIRRAGAGALPVIPKDVVLVQDCSASMAEQRLHFCRDGLSRCLALIGPDDRFNIVAFRESAERCFPEWVSPTAQNVDRARQWVGGLRSTGSTDIFGSIRTLLSLSRVAGRPVIVLLVSDGLSTVGMVKSSDIIAEFSKLNEGKVSVFTLGTMRDANGYLLDLLSYGNRGGSMVIQGGRWDIPSGIEGFMLEFWRPVLSDTGFRFASDLGVNVYPAQTSNLYLDRPLQIYGRCPRDVKEITLQAVGQAAERKCDMVFTLRLDKGAADGGKDLRSEWARQRIYFLIGEYARNPDPAILQAIKDTSRIYDVEIPHEGKF